MRGSKSTMMAMAVLFFVSTLVLVTAECPNGCSGNGVCGKKDMCTCYKNYQGNDCADRTCLFGRAHVDTPKGDINMDASRTTSGLILTNSQQSPLGTYEYFSAAAVSDEAHFYMECSNKGICDRATGLCQCFDGYEGNGCRRTTCPNKCSGQGTCESIRELGLKAPGTLVGRRGSAGIVTYDLWDSNSTYGCRCDPWFRGPDCSKRNCKVGVDPLYLSVGTARYETFIVHAYIASGTLTNAWIRLRVFDYYGESYITDPITVLTDATGQAANAAAVAAAIVNIPNLSFSTVTCESVGANGAGTSLQGFKAVRLASSVGMSVACQFTDNPGNMRVPEVSSYGVVTSAFVTTTTQQGENNDWFTVQSADVVTTIDNTNYNTLTLAATTTIAAVPALIKIGPHIVVASAATGTSVTLAFSLVHTLPSNAPIFVTDALSPAMLTVTAGVAIAAAASVGDTTLGYTTTSPALAAGDLIIFHNQFFSVQSVYQDATPNWFVQLDKPFGGSSKTGGAAAIGDTPYKVVVNTIADKTRAYNYVSECSGRGMCASDTGICACFKGYTNDNCNTQNILAV